MGETMDIPPTTEKPPAGPEAPHAVDAVALLQETASLRDRLALAVGKYRVAVLARFPEVPQELVSGDSVEAVDVSLAAARGVVDRVRAQLEARAAAERVPAGAPPRSLADVASLSPGEKIAYALSRGR